MRSSSRKGKATRQRIIDAAADLFHQQGVQATSPQQIMESSQTGKSQLYHYFRSKGGLVHEVLQHHIQSIRAGSAAIEYEIASWSDLERWFRAHAGLQEQFRMTRGCPFGTIGNEVTENDELIRRDLELLFEVVRNKLAAFFLREKARGRLGICPSWARSPRRAALFATRRRGQRLSCRKMEWTRRSSCQSDRSATRRSAWFRRKSSDAAS